MSNKFLTISISPPVYDLAFSSVYNVADGGGKAEGWWYTTIRGTGNGFGGVYNTGDAYGQYIGEAEYGKN